MSPIFSRSDRCAIAPVAPAQPPTAECPLTVASWPSGAIRFDGATLEFGAGELHRVPVESLLGVEIRPPRSGRLNFKVRHRAGFDRVTQAVWVSDTHRAELCRLAGAVQNALN
jgi:hypothetical protein